MAQSKRNRAVFFPWEKRRGLLGFFGRARAGWLAFGALVVLGVVLVHRREEHDASVRATRATITYAHELVMAYRADHDGGCPKNLADVVAAGYAHDVPVDAWGRPLRLTCPGVRDPKGFDISSDGPDGIPGGLDRVE